MKFKIGDRVRRLMDPHKPSLGYKHGNVVECYNSIGRYRTGYYPELYKVRWDCGYVEKGFLPHGLELEGKQS